jgi:hypothetical protein
MTDTGTPAETALHGAIDGLYDAFAHHRRPGSFLGCACCWVGEPDEPDERDDGQVVVVAPGGDRPLRELTPDELSAIAAEVPLTGGTVELLQHYLPRLLEIAAGEGFGWPDREIVFGRLAYGEQPWTAWPDAEQDAVRRFLQAFWHHRLATDPGEKVGYDDPAGDALCAIGLVDAEIDGYLATWLRFDEPAAGVLLERFLVTNALALRRGRLADAHWATDVPPAPANRDRVVAWVRSPATRDAVVAAAERARTPAERAALEDSYLRWLA